MNQAEYDSHLVGEVIDRLSSLVRAENRNTLVTYWGGGWNREIESKVRMYFYKQWTLNVFLSTEAQRNAGYVASDSSILLELVKVN